MTREVRLVTITLTIEVDASDADALPEQDGVLGLYGESQVPVSGLDDLARCMTDACIRESFKYLTVMQVKAMLDDAKYSVGERAVVRPLEDWFY